MRNNPSLSHLQPSERALHRPNTGLGPGFEPRRQCEELSDDVNPGVSREPHLLEPGR